MNVWLQFEGIRCFPNWQSVSVRPVTLLVGENSSGKSTFLALCQLAAAVTAGGEKPFPFNEAPFLLGAFDQIASYRGGRAGRAKSFSIGLSLNSNRNEASLVVEFVSRAGQPTSHKWSLSIGELRWEVTLAGGKGVSLLVESSRGKKVFSDLETPYGVGDHLFGLFRVPHHLLDVVTKSRGLEAHLTEDEHRNLNKTFDSLNEAFGGGTYALAPIRTSPLRTYDPVSSEPRPEGSHVPMLLSRMPPSERKTFWSAMEEFGKDSGLFEQIEVIRKGKKESDPFQIGIRSGGPPVNLVDVGYGVSQVLPVVVDALQRSAANEVLLLQQPEVHLHPRAQAELGTFFARLAAKRKRFIIETHSDHLVDRVRREVREGTIRPSDVSLLYFERGAQGSTIHPLELDKEGSITNPPEGYRQFFLDEERELLGI